MGKAKEKDKKKRDKWFGKSNLGCAKPPVVIVKDRVDMANKTHWLSFVPAAFLHRLPKNTPIISIRDKYGMPYMDGHSFTNLLPVRVDTSSTPEHYNPARLTHETVRELVSFVCTNYDKPIIIHCNEGACRSPAIATALGYCLPNLRVDTTFEGCNRNYYGDTQLTRTFIKLFEEVELEPEMAEMIKVYNERE